MSTSPSGVWTNLLRETAQYGVEHRICPCRSFERGRSRAVLWQVTGEAMKLKVMAHKSIKK